MKNMLVNVTLPAEFVSYLDEKATDNYTSRATVAKQYLIEHIEEKKVIELRRKGFSIRKIADVTDIRYDKVLAILHTTRADEDMDEELETYMDTVLKGAISKTKR